MKDINPSILLIGFVFMVYSASACYDFGFKVSQDKVYTLYRNSVFDQNMRIHVATFDADDKQDYYNKENCEIARELFQKQPGAIVKYWCEKSYFK